MRKCYFHFVEMSLARSWASPNARWGSPLAVYLLTALAALGCVAIAQGVEAGRLAVPQPLAAVSRSHLATVLWLIAFCALFLPAALRYDIGVDYSATMESAGYLGYVQMFETYAHAPMAPGMDVGFYALIRLLGLVTDNPQWMFAVLAAITYALVLRACRRLSVSPLLSLALFLVAGLYLESYNIARQWVAIACVLNGLAAVRRDAGDEVMAGEGWRRFARYAAWVLAGSLMHSSCLLWLALWPLFALRMSPRRSVVMLVAMVALFYAGAGLAATLAQGTRFGVYLDPTSPVYVGPRPRYNAVITSSVMWLFSLWAWRGKRVLDRWAGALLTCQTIGLAVTLSGFFLPFIVDRVTRYFVPLLILQLPLALAQVRDARHRRALAAIVLLAWLAATYVQVIAGGQYGVVPYRSVFGAAAAAGILS